MRDYLSELRPARDTSQLGELYEVPFVRETEPGEPGVPLPPEAEAAGER